MSDLILEIVEGPKAGQQLPLDQVIDIGREPNLPLHLDEDTQVSRRHARIAVQGGQVVAEDLGSTNGTYVNDQPINSPRALNPGDKIRVGLTVLELRTRQQVAARPSAVQVRPALTAVGNDVLQYVPDADPGRTARSASAAGSAAGGRPRLQGPGDAGGVRAARGSGRSAGHGRLRRDLTLGRREGQAAAEGRRLRDGERRGDRGDHLLRADLAIGTCTHPDDVRDITPLTPDGCAECLQAGQKEWFHLRLCLTCGHVGCCDSSPGKHASAHYRETGHPIVRSFQPGETWRWCFEHEDLLI
jgi:FHA domain-containing protein/ubiquitin-hydrolase Zn-finger-containing protein